MSKLIVCFPLRGLSKMSKMRNSARRNLAQALGFLAVSMLLSFAAQAQPNLSPDEIQEFRAFGHNVRLNTHDGETSISIDDKEMYGDAYLGIDEYAIVGGVGVIIGSSRNGSAICDFSPFIISFPKAEAARFDGAVAPCGEPVPRMTISESDIVFETDALPSKPGKKWRWTPEKGLTLEATVKHAAAEDGGWTALKSKKAQHPGSFLDYKDLNQLLRKTIGKDWNKLTPALSGPGSVDYRGDLVVGTSCEPHACDERQVLIIADIPQKRFFVGLWLPRKGEVFSYPTSENAWSREAHDVLLKWSQGQ